MRSSSRVAVLVMTVIGCVLLAACLSGCARASRGGAAILKEKPEPVQFRPVKPERWDLPNGLSVIFIDDEEIPVVSGTLYFKGGTLWEPQDRYGTLGALGGQLRDGGAGSLSADALDLELEELSASIGSSYSGEFGAVNFACLSSDLEKVFGMFADVVRRPRLEQARLDLWKGQVLESIRRRTDNPNTIAGIALNQLVYGDSVYGRAIQESDVEKINRRGLQQMYEKFVTPTGAILTIAGSVRRERIERLIQEAFGTWQGRATDLGPPPEVTFKPTPGIYFIEMPFEQATVSMGHLGVQRLSPDHIAIEVFNNVFGASGFSSRLVRKVRTDEGLAYGVYGGVNAAVVRGKNVIALQTKGSTAAQAITSSIDVLRELQSSSVAQDELYEAKASIENSFVFAFDSTADLVGRHAMLQLLKYPADYDDTYLSRIAAVDSAAVRQVAQSRWTIKDFVIVVVGNASAYTSLQTLLAGTSPTLQGLKLKKVKFQSKVIL